jgi:DNA-binding transcriptional LysR family regulator
MEDFGLRTLSVISAVATHRSFRGAAVSLEMSPSSVSHIVANTERRLGIRLFQRNTRSVSLTEAGETFLARVRPALTEITDAIEGVHHLRDSPSGLIRLNASTWAADRILPIVLGFMRDYPQVRIDLVTEGRLIDIVAEGFDAGLRLASVVSQDMVALPLGIDEALIIVASPDYVREHGEPVTPGDLLAHDCIRARLPSGAIMRWDLGKRGETLVEVSGRLIVGTTELALKAAATGTGIAYAEAREAQPYLERGDLVQLLADWTPAFPGHALYYPRQRLPSAAFRVFVDYFKACSGGRNANSFQQSYE